ncbi:hypothetical protein D3C72_2150350 [compost metagenome]
MSKPSARAVPTRMIAAPITMDGVSASSSSHAPHTTPKIGTRKVTLTAAVGPTLAIRRKKMM